MERPEEQANASGRARWLAELADALEQAQRLAWALGISDGSSTEAKQLYGRLEWVRVEVELMRRGRSGASRPAIDHSGIGPAPWGQPAP